MKVNCKELSFIFDTMTFILNTNSVTWFWIRVPTSLSWHHAHDAANVCLQSLAMTWHDAAFVCLISSRSMKGCAFMCIQSCFCVPKSLPWRANDAPWLGIMTCLSCCLRVYVAHSCAMYLHCCLFVIRGRSRNSSELGWCSTIACVAAQFMGNFLADRVSIGDCYGS